MAGPILRGVMESPLIAGNIDREPLLNLANYDYLQGKE